MSFDTISFLKRPSEVSAPLPDATSSASSAKPKSLEIAESILSTIVDRAYCQAEINAFQKKKNVFLTPDRGGKFVNRPLKNTPSRLVYPDTRPTWWDPTHRLLNKLSQTNQEEPVPKSDYNQIRQLAHQIIQMGDPVQSLLFLKLLSEFMVFGTKGIFFSVLNQLRKLNPEIEPYFADVDCDDPEEGPVFTTEAISRIFQFFEDEYNYPPGVLTAQPLSLLPSLVEEMMASEDGSIRGWVISNDLEALDPHVVPVFAIKVKGKTHIFIFDSVGHTFSTDKRAVKISASLEELIKHFRGAVDRFDQLAIFSYQIKRQNGDLGCSTFSVLDLKNLLERHMSGEGNIVDFYVSQTEINRPKLAIHDLDPDTDLPVYEITILPPEMMKVTQSLSRIRQYGKSSPVDEFAPAVERYSPSWDTCIQIQDFNDLSATVSQIERCDPEGSIKNLYVDQKRLKFIVYLLGLHFRSESPVADLITPAARTHRSARQLFFSDAEPDGKVQEHKGLPRRLPPPRLPPSSINEPLVLLDLPDFPKGPSACADSDTLVVRLDSLSSVEDDEDFLEVPDDNFGYPDLSLMQVSDFEDDDK